MCIGPDRSLNLKNQNQNEKKSPKGIVIVISSDPVWKNANARFTSVFLNLYLINNVEDIVVYLGLKVLNSYNFYNFFISYLIIQSFMSVDQYFAECRVVC